MKLSATDIDKYVLHHLDSLNIPGISIAIINDGHIVYHQVFGVSNFETQEKIQQTSIFEAASLSKPMFAFFALKMVEKGIIDLDRPLFYYLDDLDMHVDDRYEQVTMRMVLNHTTGFPNWRWFDPPPPDLNLRKGDFYMKADPNTFTYSGEGYQYLARVLAHNNFVNMFELGALFKTEVVDQVGMDQAYFVWDDNILLHKVYGHKEGRLDGRQWGAGLPHHHSKIFNAAGGLHTEAKSYASFLIALLNEKGLDPGLFKEMFAEQIQLPKNHRFFQNENTKAWGLGIAIEEYKGKKFYKHGGNNGGFMSGFMINKTTKNGYVYFINCDKGKELEQAMRRLMLHQ